MEELLNKLIEKGWKAFGRNYCKYEKWCLYYTVHTEDGVWSEWRYWVSLRELVSKESWLWQFVCENKLIKKDRFTWMISPDPLLEDQYNYTDYRYRLIESALKDESKLESFILDNIKV